MYTERGLHCTCNGQANIVNAERCGWIPHHCTSAHTADIYGHAKDPPINLSLIWKRLLVRIVAIEGPLPKEKSDRDVRTALGRDYDVDRS